MNQDELISLQITTLATKLATQATQAGNVLVPKLPDPRELRQAQLEISGIVLERAFAARSRGEA